jgi:hypothetical protein
VSGVIQCFVLEPTDQAEVFLRRYEGAADGTPLCPVTEPVRYGYHNAHLTIGRTAVPDASKWGGPVRPELAHDDPRWPTHCSCGHPFTPGDIRQHQWEILLRRSDNGELVTLDRAPVGAMWFADWYAFKGPDGRCLVVRTPAGDWIVDSPSSNSRTPWTRTGTPPFVTATPSILFDPERNGGCGYHGWLRDGKLLPA